MGVLCTADLGTGRVDDGTSGLSEVRLPVPLRPTSPAKSLCFGFWCLDSWHGPEASWSMVANEACRLAVGDTVDASEACRPSVGETADASEACRLAVCDTANASELCRLATSEFCRLFEALLTLHCRESWRGVCTLACPTGF